VDIDTSSGRPEMDYAEHKKTYALFMAGVKWGTVTVIALLVLMAMTLI